jgi:hypothetical protein
MDTNRTVASRLRELLLERGFRDNGGRPAVMHAVRVISVRTKQEMAPARFVNILNGTAECTPVELVMIADGLGVDVRELLYDREELAQLNHRLANPLDPAE